MGSCARLHQQVRCYSKRSLPSLAAAASRRIIPASHFTTTFPVALAAANAAQFTPRTACIGMAAAPFWFKLQDNCRCCGNIPFRVYPRLEAVRVAAISWFFSLLYIVPCFGDNPAAFAKAVDLLRLSFLFQMQAQHRKTTILFEPLLLLPFGQRRFFRAVLEFVKAKFRNKNSLAHLSATPSFRSCRYRRIGRISHFQAQRADTAHDSRTDTLLCSVRGT